MAGTSKLTTRITLRLPNDVLEVNIRRAKRNNVSVYAYLQERVIYDTCRKHRKGREIEEE